nr:hypothetical protein CFP56_39854 [Quercus suber]
MHPETPLYPPTSSNAPTLPINPPRTEPMTMIPTHGLYTEHYYPLTSSSSDPLGPPVGIDTLQPDIDVPDEHPPHQPSPPRVHFILIITPNIDCMDLMSLQHDDEPKDDAP